jgi:hypothetical protein
MPSASCGGCQVIIVIGTQDELDALVSLVKT